MTHSELIKYYKQRLEKVKKHWPLDSKNVDTERSKGYIDHAKNELKAVKNGRTW